MFSEARQSFPYMDLSPIKIGCTLIVFVCEGSFFLSLIINIVSNDSRVRNLLPYFTTISPFGHAMVVGNTISLVSVNESYYGSRYNICRYRPCICTWCVVWGPPGSCLFCPFYMPMSYINLYTRGTFESGKDDFFHWRSVKRMSLQQWWSKWHIYRPP